MSEEEGWSEVRQQHDLDDRYEGDNKDDNYELRTVPMPHDLPRNGVPWDYEQ
jgi:hypothetical protein